jgi:5S rRNA maturation endonuclease (ribonuclease M5)
MNEHIKALIAQAHSEVGNDYQIDQITEKFAELIVKESIKVMIENDYHGEWLGKKIKQHFGIE